MQPNRAGIAAAGIMFPRTGLLAWQPVVERQFFLVLREKSLYDEGMSLGKRGPDEKQEPIWIEAARLATHVGHPFHERLNRLLNKRGFDTFAESACESFYAKVGRPAFASVRCLSGISKVSIPNAALHGGPIHRSPVESWTENCRLM